MESHKSESKEIAAPLMLKTTEDSRSLETKTIATYPPHLLKQLQEIGRIDSQEKHPEKNIWLFLVANRTKMAVIWDADSNTVLKKEIGETRTLNFLSSQFILGSYGGAVTLYDYSLNRLTPPPALASALKKIDKNNCITLSFNPTQIIVANDKAQTLNYVEMTLGESHSINITQFFALPFERLSQGRKNESRARSERSGDPLISVHSMCRLSSKNIALCGRDNGIMFIRECSVEENELIPDPIFSKIGHDMEMKISCIEPLPDGRLAIFSQPEAHHLEDEDELVLQYFLKNSSGQWRCVLDKGYDKSLGSINDQIDVTKRSWLFHKVPLPNIVVFLQTEWGICCGAAIFNLEKGIFVPGSKRHVNIIDALSRPLYTSDYNTFAYPGENANISYDDDSSSHVPLACSEYHFLTREDLTNKEEYVKCLETLDTIPELSNLNSSECTPKKILPLIASYLTLFKPTSEEKLERPTFEDRMQFIFPS